MEFAVRGHQAVQAEALVQAARIRQHPDARAAERRALLAPGDGAGADDFTIGGLAQEGDASRLVADDFGAQRDGGGGKFATPDFVGAPGRARHHRRQAIAHRQHAGVVLGRHLVRGQAGQVQHFPEAVAAADKMVTAGGGSGAGIEADKYQPQSGAENVGQSLNWILGWHGSWARDVTSQYPPESCAGPVLLTFIRGRCGAFSGQGPLRAADNDKELCVNLALRIFWLPDLDWNQGPAD